MSFKTCSEMGEHLRNWEFLEKLPGKILDFSLSLPFAAGALELVIARYANDDHCALELIYTQETGDFVPVKVVGLNRFRDERFFCGDQDVFAQTMLQVLSDLVGAVSRNSACFYPAAARELGLDQWEGWRNFPKKVGNLELFITPEHPLEFLNGSLVFLDYSDFERRNQLMVLYNEYRNEIFADLKREGIAEYTRDFDLPIEEKLGEKGKNILPKLEQLFAQNLQKNLEKLQA